MKKLYQEPKHIRHSQRRSQREEIARINHAKIVREKRQSQHGIPKKKQKINSIIKHRGFNRVCAPVLCSFVQKPEEFCIFICELDQLYVKRKKAYVVLESVEKITDDAIVVLLSIMIKFKSKDIEFNGDFPKNKDANNVLLKSGFFTYLYRRYNERDRYELHSSNEESIFTHAWKQVDSALGAKIICAASKTIWGEERRCQGVQRTLLELMQNTNNHADQSASGKKHWWLSVNHIPEENKVCFSFVDFGIGVFESLANKPKDSKFFNWESILKAAHPFRTNADLLRLILNGKLHKTVTQMPFRGKGLPGIAEALKKRKISRLHIVTNNVFCDVSNDNFISLRESFSGTFVYWEVTKDNVSCK